MMHCIEIKNKKLIPSKRSVPTIKNEEVLIKVSHAGINRPDVFQRLGNYPPPKGASDIPGLEISGTIIESKSPLFEKGQTVCALVTGGGYAEYVNAPAVQCLPIPDGWSLKQAAALPETLFTVWKNIGPYLKEGKTLLVHGGSSGIGHIAIQMAKALNMRVVTTVGNDDKKQFCEKLGADLVIQYNQDDYHDTIINQWGEKAIDIVLDMIGGDYFPKNINLLAQKGVHVTIATLRGGQSNIDLRQVLIKNLTITGSTLRANPVEEKAIIAQSIKKNLWERLVTKQIIPVIDQEFSLNNAEKAHEFMEKSEHKGKIILNI